MPNTKSALKAFRQNQRRRLVNKSRTSVLRTTIKSFQKRLAAGDVEGARALLGETYGRIDKACKIGIIHRNTASRTKSRLAAALNRTTTSQA